MAGRPPFDIVRASFLLLAAVIGAHVVMALSAEGACIYGILSHAIPVGTCDKTAGLILEALNAALAVALAFSGRGTPKE